MIKVFASVLLILGGGIWGQSNVWGPWSWDPENLSLDQKAIHGPKQLFSWGPQIPPTLFVTPGPESSLLLLYPEKGLLKILIPGRAAILNLDLAKSFPNDFILFQGQILVAENRQIRRLFPPGPEVIAPELHLPVLELAASGGVLKAKVLGGKWYALEEGRWNPGTGGSPVEPAPVEFYGKGPWNGGIPFDAPMDQWIQDLEDWGRVPEAYHLAQVSQEYPSESGYRLGELTRGRGRISGEIREGELTLAFDPDRPGIKPRNWKVFLEAATGMVTFGLSRETPGHRLGVNINPQDFPQGLLWADVRVEDTVARIINRDGLSTWLKRY